MVLWYFKIRLRWREGFWLRPWSTGAECTKTGSGSYIRLEDSALGFRVYLQSPL